MFGLSSISELPEAGSIEAAISSLTETGSEEEDAAEEAGTAGDGSADESGDTPDGEDTLPEKS